MKFSNEVIEINNRREGGRREHFFPNETEREDRAESSANEGNREAASEAVL